MQIKKFLLNVLIFFLQHSGNFELAYSLVSVL